MLKCDFCSSKPITAVYDAADFLIPAFSTPDINQASKGAWAACADCEALIDANNWQGLVTRVADLFIQTYPIISRMRPEIERDFTLMYSQLQSNRFSKRRS